VRSGAEHRAVEARTARLDSEAQARSTAARPVEAEEAATHRTPGSLVAAVERTATARTGLAALPVQSVRPVATVRPLPSRIAARAAEAEEEERVRSAVQEATVGSVREEEAEVPVPEPTREEIRARAGTVE